MSVKANEARKSLLAPNSSASLPSPLIPLQGSRPTAVSVYQA